MSVVSSYRCDHCSEAMGDQDDGVNGEELEDQMFIGSQGALHICESCTYEYREFFTYAI